MMETAALFPAKHHQAARTIETRVTFAEKTANVTLLYRILHILYKPTASKTASQASGRRSITKRFPVCQPPVIEFPGCLFLATL